MNYIYLFVSIIFYVLLPVKYSFFMAILYLLVFTLSFMHTLRRYKIGYVSWYFLFSCAFFISNFLVPVFGYSFYPIEQIFNYSIDANYILRGEALSLVAYCSFVSGISISFSKKKCLQKESLVFSAKIEFISSFKYIAVILLCVYTMIHIFAFSFTYGEYNKKIFNTPMVATLLDVITYVYVLYLCWFFFKNRKETISVMVKNGIFLWAFLLFLTCAYIRIGERGNLIKILLPVVFGYNFIIRRISYKVLFLIVVLGFSLMLFIRDSRNDSAYANHLKYRKYELPSYLDNTSDLTCATMTMCLGLEYVEKNGYLYGRTMISDLFAPIPFVPAMINNYVFEGSMVSTGRILSDEVGLGIESGVGTSAVVDVFMNFGVIGVIVLFLLFGYFISYLEKLKYKSVYCLCVYVMMVGVAVYIPRSTLFSVIRGCVWMYFLLLLFKKKYKYSHVIKTNDK